MPTPTPNKDDPKKNPEPNRAGTDVNKNVDSVTERTDEQKEQDDADRKAYAAKMQYATKVSESDEPIMYGEDNASAVSDLVADGLAQLRARQVGTKTENWIELTDEGRRAVQAYNSKTD